MKQYPTSFRFSDEARDLIDRLAHYLGISKASVIELAVRRLARTELPDSKFTPRSKAKKRKAKD
jgi:hypothetical protein